MRRQHIIMWVLVGLLMPIQAWAAKPLLLGQVYLIGEHDEKLPAANVAVKLEGRSDPTVTLSQGEFELPLPTITKRGKEQPLYGPGERIKLIVEKPDWIIHSPVDGETPLPADLLKETVEIRLLPVGSHKLWSHERFQKEMRDLKDKTTEQIQPQQETPQEITFEQHIARLADKLGFPKEEVKARLDQWAKEAEQAKDPYDKALAEYYNKNFTQAKALFQQSADLKLQELAAIQQQEDALQKRKLQVIEEAVDRLKGKGDAAYSAYEFEEALRAYEQARSVLPKDQLHRLRADVQMDIAGVNWALGIRTEGQKLHAHLNQAKQAYQEAAKTYTELGQKEGQASAQVGLGLIHQEQGIRTGGEEGQALLAQAVAAYRAALEVRTKESLAPQWAQTHNNLAEAALALEDWEQVVTSYGNVMELYPDYGEAYSMTIAVLHEKLFRYGEAFGLNQQWLEGHPEDLSGQMNFAEAHLTTGRFSEAEQRFAELLNGSELDAQATIPLTLLSVVSRVGQNKMDSAAGQLHDIRGLLVKQPEDFLLGWSFEGTKHFIGQDEAFVNLRDWLVPLLEAFSGKPCDEMLAAVETVQAQLASPPSP